MPPANPSILEWKPAEEEESASTPCGGEHVRCPVFATTPRSPIGTPRPKINYSGNNAPTTSGKFSAIQKILKVQNAEMVKLIQDSMLRHEAAITSLLNADSVDLAPFAGDLLIHSNSWAIKNQYVHETKTIADVAVAPIKTRGSVATTMDGDADSASSEPGNKLARPASIKSRNFNKITEECKESQDLCPCGPTHLNIKSCMRHYRVVCKRILSSRAYDQIMAVLIILNSILIIVETDANVGCHREASGCAPSWLFFANVVFLVIYTCESFAVIDVYRWEIFAERSHLFELFVVVSGWVDILISIVGKSLPSMQVLKLVRLSRLLRGVRLFSIFPELHAIMSGFISSMRTMVWGFVVLMLVLIILSIGSVELLQDMNKQVGHDSEYCDEAFNSVWNATILLFQITAAADNWGACSMEMMKLQPLTFAFFASCVVSVQTGFLNLIMSVILQRAEAARVSDIRSRFRGKQVQMKANKCKWAKLFQSLDADGSGVLTLDEIVEGFENLPSFREEWALLGIMTEDLPELFHLIDENQDGYITMDELLELLHKLYHSDRDMQQVTMSMQLRVIAERLETRLKDIQMNILPSYTTALGPYAGS